MTLLMCINRHQPRPPAEGAGHEGRSAWLLGTRYFYFTSVVCATRLSNCSAVSAVGLISTSRLATTAALVARSVHAEGTQLNGACSVSQCRRLDSAACRSRLTPAAEAGESPPLGHSMLQRLVRRCQVLIAAGYWRQPQAACRQATRFRCSMRGVKAWCHPRCEARPLRRRR
eukprot:scaffold1139_cov62-Phaeocystis_antarctica.AAC.3